MVTLPDVVESITGLNGLNTISTTVAKINIFLRFSDVNNLTKNGFNYFEIHVVLLIEYVLINVYQQVMLHSYCWNTL